MVFPVVMYTCTHAGPQRRPTAKEHFKENWCFQSVVLDKTLENPLDSKEIKPEYSFKGLMLKLKLQYFGHLMQRATHWKWPWYWERMKAGGEEGNRGWYGWITSPTQWTWIWANSGRQLSTGKPVVHGIPKSWTWLSDWTTTTAA